MYKKDNIAKFNSENGYYEIELKAPQCEGNYIANAIIIDLFGEEHEINKQYNVIRMSIETEIKKILSKLNIPVAHIKYKGNERTYVVWTIVVNVPILASDDEITHSEITVDIDIYSESNYLSLISSIKKIMKENDWMWHEDGEEMYEEDTKLYHNTCTFIKERMV